MKALSGSLSVVALLMFLAGPFAVGRPSLFRLTKRRHALALWAFSLVVLGLAIDLDPPEPQQDAVGGPMLVIWLVLIGAGWITLRLFKRRTSGSRAESELLAERVGAEIGFLGRLGGRARHRDDGNRQGHGGDRYHAAPPQQDSRWRAGQAGRYATFTYVDADGVVTDRKVSNWRSDGAYVEAFCLDRRASRTFRKDRIEDWQGA